MKFIPPALVPHLRRFGLSGVAAVALVIVMIFGVNPITLISGKTAPPPPPTSITGVPKGAGTEAELIAYPKIVAGEAEVMWRGFFRQTSMKFEGPELVTGDGPQVFGCGLAGKDLTVAYCPADNHIYVDVAAYKGLRDRFPLGADYALAHLVAEAYGQYAQQATGQFDNLRAIRAGEDAEAVAVVEKQLDEQAQCHAALWTAAAGIASLADDAGVQAALADIEARRAAVIRPESPGEIVPVLLARASAEGRKLWYSKGFAIPAAGTCRIEKIAAEGVL
jgi:predicted metalloprotease